MTMASKLTGLEPQLANHVDRDFSSGDEPSLGGARHFDQHIWLRLIDPRWPHKESLVAALSDDACTLYADLLLKVLPGGSIFSEATTNGPLAHPYSSAQRGTAAYVIGLIGSRVSQAISAKYVEPLVAQLSVEVDLSVKAEVARALGIIGSDKAEGELLAAFMTADWRLRQFVIGALKTVGGSRSLQFLWSVYDQHESLNESKAALEAIGTIAARLGEHVRSETYTRLMHLLLRSDSMLRGAAARALGNLHDRRALDLLVKFALDGRGDLQVAAVQSLGLLGEAEAVAPLIFVLTNGEYAARQDAAQALITIGRPSIGPALAVLRHPDSNVRRGVIDVLGKVRATDAIDPLTELLTDLDQDVRRAAVNALGAIADPGSVDALVGALNDPDAGVRKEAAMMLGSFRDARAVGPLCLALWDADMTVRWFAAYTIGAIGDPRGVKPLIRALGDKSMNVSQTAADSLVRLGDAAVDDLIALVRSDQGADMNIASRILMQIHTDRAREALNQLGILSAQN